MYHAEYVGIAFWRCTGVSHSIRAYAEHRILEWFVQLSGAIGAPCAKHAITISATVTATVSVTVTLTTTLPLTLTLNRT